MQITKNKVFVSAMAGVLGVGMALSLTGCGGAGGASGKVAATVNGQDILEQTITDYVQSYRSSNNLTNDQEWAQWMVDNGYTAEQLRTDAINYYVEQAVVAQDSKSKNLSVGDEEVDSQINEIKSYYGYDDSQWESALSDIGYTADSYREYVRNALLQTALQKDVVTDATATDDAIVEMANTYATTIDGAKNINTVAFELGDADKAKTVAQDIKDGKITFEAAQEQYSPDNTYNGWDCLVYYDTAVTDAAKEMSKGSVSDPITGSDKIYIIQVLDTATVPADGFTSVSQVPEGLATEFRANVETTNSYTQFSDYVKNLVDSADIKINDMPSGLPYAVSTEGLTANNTTESGSGEGTTSNNTTNTEGAATSGNTIAENTEAQVTNAQQ